MRLAGGEGFGLLTTARDESKLYLGYPGVTPITLPSSCRSSNAGTTQGLADIKVMKIADALPVLCEVKCSRKTSPDCEK
jgi:hypothetical protein